MSGPRTNVGRQFKGELMMSKKRPIVLGEDYVDQRIRAIESEASELAAGLTNERLAEALCQAQEAGQTLDQVATTTAAHWRGVAARTLHTWAISQLIAERTAESRAIEAAEEK